MRVCVGLIMLFFQDKYSLLSIAVKFSFNFILIRPRADFDLFQRIFYLYQSPCHDENILENETINQTAPHTQLTESEILPKG